MYKKYNYLQVFRVKFFQCLLLNLFIIVCNSIITRQYFGTRTTDGPNGIVYYSVKLVNDGYANELNNNLLNTNNYILGVVGDNNKADILFSSNVYIQGTTTSVAITTIEYARDTNRLLCTYSQDGVAKFGSVTFTDTNKADKKIAYITELTPDYPSQGVLLSNLNVKIGVSNYFTQQQSTNKRSAYMFAAWTSLEEADSLWLIEIDDTNKFSINITDNLLPNANEIAAITRHEARDIPSDITAMDVVTKARNGEWGCATLQFGKYAKYHERKDVYFLRANETGEVFKLFGSGSYSMTDLQASMKVNNGVGLFYTISENVTSLGKMSTLLKPRLSTNAFKEPENWGYAIEAKFVLPITNVSAFNATLFKLALVESTPAKKLSDIVVQGAVLITYTSPERRLNTKTLRRLEAKKNVTGLQVKFTLNLEKSTPGKTLEKVEELTDENSVSAKNFQSVFPVLPTVSIIEEIEQIVDVGEIKIIVDQCVSSKIGSIPEVPEKLFWPLKLDKQYSPAPLDAAIDQSPMVYDIFDTTASLAIKLRTQSFDISVLVLEQKRISDKYVPTCKCNNGIYPEWGNDKCDNKNIKTVSKAEIIQNGTFIDRVKLFAHHILCANINRLEYGKHGEYLSIVSDGTSCKGYFEELYLTNLKPSTTYYVFTVAHAGSQSSKPYTTEFQTMHYTPSVQFSIKSITSDGFSIDAKYDTELQHPARFIYMVVARESLSQTNCDSTTSWQMANLIYNNIVDGFKACNESILYKGVEEVPQSGHKRARIVSKDLTNKLYKRFKYAAKLAVFVVGEYNYSHVDDGSHGTYSPRFRNFLQLAHHNISLSSATLPENASATIDVYAHLSYRPVPGELFNFTCFVTGYITNVYVVHINTPSASQNNKWNLKKHLIARLFAVQDQNNTELTRLSFAVTCKNQIMYPLHSAKLGPLTYHDEMFSSQIAETLNIVWPNWSDAYVLKTDQKSNYHFEDEIESLTTYGNQTFIFKQNNPTWSGQMYTPKVRIEIDGLNTWEVQVSQNGRILNFSTPSYQQLCPTKQNCTRDLAYKKLVIANPYEITEPRLVGARGGFYEIDTVFAYQRCSNVEAFTDDPDICWDKYKSSEKCAFGSGDECVNCPSHAICPGGNRAWPHERYWNVDDYSDQVVRCSAPSLKRCMVHNRKNRSVICGPTYDNSSYACEKCAVDHYPLWRQCVKCPEYYEEKTSIFVSVVLAISYLVAFMFALNVFIYVSLIGVGGSILSSWYLTKRFLLELVFYVQLIAVAAKPIYPLQTTYAAAVSYTLDAIMIDWDIFIPLSCFEEIPPLFYSDRIYMLTALSAGSIFVILSFSKRFRPEMYCKRNSTKRCCKNQVTPYFRYWLLVLLGVLYAKVSTSVFSLLTCSKIDNTLPRLDRDISVTCYEGDHQLILPLVYVTLAIYVIGFPIGSTYYLYFTFFGIHRHKYMERSELTVFEFWMNDDFQHWRHRERLWHFLMICLLSFTSVFFTKIHMLLYGLIIDLSLLVIYFGLVFWYSPLYRKIHLKERIQDAFLFEEAGAKVIKDQDDHVPDKFIGPLSKKIMINPVVTASGQTYERAMIGRWFARGNITDPISKRPMQSLQLQPAISLTREIHAWKMKQKKKAMKKERKNSFVGTSGWKGDSSENKRLIEEVYERELIAMEELFTDSLDEQEEQAQANRKLKFKAHMVLKRSATTLELKSIRLVLTSETDPFFNLQDECGQEAFQMIKGQYDLVASFEDFPQLLSSMLDRSVDEKDVFKLVITPAPGDLEFAQLGIRNLTMKGQFSEVLVLNLMPSKYTPQIAWLFVGKLGAIIAAICMVVLSYLMTAKHEGLDANLESFTLDNVELGITIVVLFYGCLMLLLYQVVSHRFGTKMHIADENRQILAGKGEDVGDNDDEEETEEQIWAKSKIKALRAKHKNLVVKHGAYDVKTISAHGDLGLLLVEQPGKIKEGIKILRDTLRGLAKARVGVGNPTFLQYQKSLLKYEKIDLENKRKDRHSITNVEEDVPDIIEVHAFENNKAQLWGPWFGSHKVYKSKHACAVFAQRLRGLIILLEGFSMIILIHTEADTSGLIVAKVSSMFAVQVLFLIFIDHNHLLGKMTYARPILLMIDLAAAGILFLSTVAAAYALITLQLHRTIMIAMALQGATCVFSSLMCLAIVLEMFENLWYWILSSCRKRRQTVRKRRNTVRRKSMQQHFSSFANEETKLDPFDVINNPMKKQRKKSKYSTDIPMFDNPLIDREKTRVSKKDRKKSEKVEQEYLNPMVLKQISAGDGDVQSVMDVINPMLGMETKKEKRRSSRKSRKYSEDETARKSRREERRSRKEGGEDEETRRAKREERRSRKEVGEDEEARRARREERRSRREKGGGSEAEEAARRARREERRSRREQTGVEPGRKSRRDKKRVEARGEEEKARRARHSQRKIEREQLERMGIKPPRSSEKSGRKKKKKRHTSRPGSVTDSLAQFRGGRP